ncbi:Ig-like domain-containing protein [Undibacterium arcticum]
MLRSRCVREIDLSVKHDEAVKKEQQQKQRSDRNFFRRRIGIETQGKQMKKKLQRHGKPLMWLSAVLMTALVAGCGGGGQGRDPILGTGGVAALVPPTVTAVAPVNNATGVPMDNAIINAAFSESMAPITGGASFTVTCAAPCVNPTGTVALDATNKIATFTSANPLASATLYTATVTGAKSLTTGLALASPYVWTFTTAADTTPPTVTLVNPIDPSPTACLQKK